MASNLLGSTVDREKKLLDKLQVGPINLGGDTHP